MDTPLESFTRAAIDVILRTQFWGARLRWAARVDDEPAASEGGDPNGTYKRWFGRVSGRAGWWRGSSLVDASYWPEALEGCAQARCHARDRVQRMDAAMQLLRGQPWSVGNDARAGDGGVQADSAVFSARQVVGLREIVNP
jgi:hypothetical protein